MAHNTQIGKGLLEQLMFSLYRDAETIYREYLQNASDSIKEAIDKKIITPEEGHVTINIDKAHNRVTIEDNGTGVSAKEAESRLKDIAKSNKRADYFAGFYGIGRLVGAGYCKTLSFKTSAKGENVASEMVYDVDKIRKILNDDDNEMGAAEVIDRVTTFTNTIPEVSQKNYFIVTLDGILPEYPTLLRVEDVHKYLLQVAPIPYTPEFRNNLINPTLAEIDKKYYKYVSNLNAIQVSVNNIVNIRKPYGLTISGTGDEVARLRFFTLSDVQYGDLAWGWYAVTPFDKAIPDIDPETNAPVITRGIRIRSHNIQIGSESFFDGTEYFKQARSNKYFNGEINILNPRIKPNTARDGLANTPEAIRLKELIREFFNGELQKVYQTANKVKKELERAKDAEILHLETTKKEDTKKNFPQDSKSEQLKKAAQDKKDAESSFKKIQEKKEDDSEGMKAMLEIYQKKFEDFKSQIEDGSFDVSTEKGKSKNTKQKKDKFEQNMVKLSSKYGDDSIDLIKRIFRIMDLRYRESSHIIRSIKNSIIKDLLEQ